MDYMKMHGKQVCTTNCKRAVKKCIELRCEKKNGDERFFCKDECEGQSESCEENCWILWRHNWDVVQFYYYGDVKNMNGLIEIYLFCVFDIQKYTNEIVLSGS